MVDGIDSSRSIRYHQFLPCCDSFSGCSGITNNIMEVKHAEGIRRSTPFLPQQAILLKDLWERLPDEARQKSLLALSQIAARQLVPPPAKKGAGK